MSKKSELLKAADNGDAEWLEVLCNQEGVDLYEKDSTGRTALHYAAEGGHISCIECLLNHGMNIDVGDRNKWTPLHYAASVNQFAAVKRLVDRGADIDAETIAKYTPISLAAEDGYNKIVEFLESAKSHKLLNASSKDGMAEGSQLNF